ncbi:MAG: ATP-binding protein [Candidatus Dormibacteraceae bacterium]
MKPTLLSGLRATTRGRLSLISVAILAVAVGIAGAATYEAFAISGTAEVDGTLLAEATVLASGIDERGGQLTFRGDQLPTETVSGIAVSGAVVNSLGVVLQTPRQPLAVATTLMGIVSQVRKTGHGVWTTTSDIQGIPRRIYAEPLSNADGLGAVLVVSRSIKELESQLTRLLLLLILFACIIVTLGGVLSYWLAGRVLRPVHTIAAAARSLGESDLHRRVEAIVPNDELGELVQTFNGMLERLESSFNSLKQITADASHEMRAPLALMQTEVEVALSRSRSEPEYVRALGAVHSEIRGLSGVTERLLILARADAGALVPILEKVDVADFLHEAAARWTTMARKRRVKLQVEVPDSGSVEADPSLLRRLIDNLLDNAIRHSPRGGRIWLRASDTNAAWTIEVADEGPGVPPGEREKIFVRFSRTDGARTRDGGGAGLGLALGSAIARAHGGDLSLARDREPRGALFLLRIPRRPGSNQADAVPAAPAQVPSWHSRSLATLSAAFRKLAP